MFSCISGSPSRTNVPTTISLRHQQYPAHRHRGGRTHANRAAALRLARSRGRWTPPLPCNQRSRARSRHARTSHCTHIESRSAHAAAAIAAATGQQHAHARCAARRTRRARSPSTAANSSAADCRHHARTTTHDDEKMLSAHTGAKPETMIDGVRRHWATAPATGSSPCSSHASVAHTATRSSSQGPASALRFNYFLLVAPRPRRSYVCNVCQHEEWWAVGSTRVASTRSVPWSKHISPSRSPSLARPCQDHEELIGAFLLSCCAPSSGMSRGKSTKNTPTRNQTGLFASPRSLQ